MPSESNPTSDGIPEVKVTRGSNQIPIEITGSYQGVRNPNDTVIGLAVVVGGGFVLLKILKRLWKAL